MFRQYFLKPWAIITGLVIITAMVPIATFAATTVGTNVSVGGTLDVTGAATFNSTLATTGAVTFNGNITLGNATSTDIFFLNARIAGSLIPTVNNSIDLGEYERAYKGLVNKLVGKSPQR